MARVSDKLVVLKSMQMKHVSTLSIQDTVISDKLEKAAEVYLNKLQMVAQKMHEPWQSEP